jgi:hypothetical protein
MAIYGSYDHRLYTFYHDAAENPPPPSLGVRYLGTSPAVEADPVGAPGVFVTTHHYDPNFPEDIAGQVTFLGAPVTHLGEVVTYLGA